MLISKEVYEDRKDSFTLRVKAMVDYVSRTDVCRSRALLEYFGEDHPQDCGQCDVCLGRKRSHSEKQEGRSMAQLGQDILKVLTEESPLTLHALVDRLHTEANPVRQAVEYLLGEEQIHFDDNNQTIYIN
jgi:ATP-dependent DNA helicase RecQ